MYSDLDVEAAVTGGALSSEAAQSFRDFVARARATPGADEEQFRLLTGFNDIFVTIAIVLLLAALGWLGASVTPILGPAAIAVVSWGLAEYFTRRRRMALPSIVLVLSFTGAVLATALSGFGRSISPFSLGEGAGDLVVWCGCASVTAVAAAAHWRRFSVPVTVAVATGAGAGMVVLLLFSAVPALLDHSLVLVLVLGLIVFAFAMWWDTRDRMRVTRRSDVAFWLHLLAAPLIVHPVFNMLGLLKGGEAQTEHAAIAVALYLLLAVIALAVDRRAILVSALIYVLYAMSSLLEGVGSLDTAFAVAALAIGGMLLMLSALWQRARRPVVQLLPARVQAGLPPVQVR